MNQDNYLARKWVLAGIICGFLADVVYFVSSTANLPARIAYPVFWSFGPLLIVAAMGLYYFLRQHGRAVALQLGAIFMVIAGASVTMMGTMQGASGVALQEIKPEEMNESARVAWKMAMTAADSIQMGADLAWDIFIFTGIVLLGKVMLRNPCFGKVIGLAGIIIGLLGLAFNIYTFPKNPATAGLVDVGPLVGLWFLVVTIQMIRHFKTIGNSDMI